MGEKSDRHSSGRRIDQYRTDNQNNISPLRPMRRGDMAYVLSQYLQRQQGQLAMLVTPDVIPPPEK